MDKEKTIEILSTLANGVDPVTGEVFPEGSPYQNVKVVRALFNAVDIMKTTKTKIAKKEGLSNSNQPWTEDEDEQLKDAFLDGKTIDELSIIHQRSTGAIRSRLEKHRFIDRYGKKIVFK